MTSYEALKRVADIVVTAIGHVLLYPVFVLITVLVRLKLGSPAFRHREHIGRWSKPLVILKFRTMADKSVPAPSHALVCAHPVRAGSP